MLVFATPKFCSTKTCGPTLEKIKTVATAHPDVTFINVEPYLLEVVDGQLQPVLSDANELQTAPATDAYGLLTEPFVFVVDGDGVVKASFELIFTPDEIDRGADGHQLGEAAGGVLEPERDVLAVLVAIRHPDRHGVRRGARRGGRAGTRRRSPADRCGIRRSAHPASGSRSRGRP